jgi:catechol 2,3-dioxygenase-like lactoylglutathione lyase family enzyme
MTGVQHLDHLNLTVASFDESVAWYRRVFGFQLVEDGVQEGVRWGVLRAGEAMLCIYEHGELGGVAERGQRVNHFGLRITDPDAWQQTVADESLDLLYGGAVEWPHSTAWYIEDPTGYEIEVCHWHEGSSRFGTTG